jgi:hypothetical protein
VCTARLTIANSVATQPEGSATLISTPAAWHDLELLPFIQYPHSLSPYHHPNIILPYPS